MPMPSEMRPLFAVAIGLAIAAAAFLLPLQWGIGFDFRGRALVFPLRLIVSYTALLIGCFVGVVLLVRLFSKD